MMRRPLALALIVASAPLWAQVGAPPVDPATASSAPAAADDPAVAVPDDAAATRDAVAPPTNDAPPPIDAEEDEPIDANAEDGAAVTDGDVPVEDPANVGHAMAPVGGGLAARPWWFYLACGVFVLSGIALLLRAILPRRTPGQRPALAVRPVQPAAASSSPNSAVPGEEIRYQLVEAGGSLVITVNGDALRSHNGFCIGRNPDFADVVLADAGVSRRHLRFASNGDDLVVEDLNSTQGTRLNGVALKPFASVAAKPGDRIALAGHDFVVRAAE